MGKLNKLTFVLFGVVGILLVAVIVVGIIKIGGRSNEPDPKPEKTQEETPEKTKKEPEESKTEKPTETQTEKPKEEEVIFQDFEGEVTGFTPRGSEIVEVVEGGVDGSGHALKCYNRTEYWHGAMWNSNGALQGGDKIKGSVMVKYEYTSEDPADTLDFDVLEITLEFNLNGQPQYPQMGMIKVANGSWIELKGEYEIPEGATDIKIYVEAERLEDLFIDDFRIIKE